MRNILFVVLLISMACLSACEKLGHGGRPAGQSSQAIVNGTATPEAVDLTAGEQLAIGYLHPRGDTSYNFCTGTIISPRLVATAQHCTEGSSASELSFSVGPSISSPAATFTVSELWEHGGVDAAILVLGTDATATLPTLEPIPFNREDIDNGDVGAALQAGGYGDTFDTNPEGRWFATVYLDEVEDAEIVVDGRGAQGICQGDSGGPVIWENSGGDHVVLAVESWGDDSCVDRDHLTRLDPLEDWIDGIETGDVPEDPCATLDFIGRCEGTLLEWCDDGVYRRRECGDHGGACSFLNEDLGNVCTCGPITYHGRCVDNVVEYCEDDSYFTQINCNSQGLSCGWESDEVGYNCTQEASCSPQDIAGYCDGDTAVRCDEGRTVREDCAGRSQTCSEAAATVTCVGDSPTADVGSTDSDAGSTDSDAGSTDSDAGSTDSDAGSTDSDAGSTGSDAGSTGSDVTLGEVGPGVEGGLTTPDSEENGDDGCSVNAHSHRGRAPWALALTALLLGFTLLRRRQQIPE